MDAIQYHLSYFFTIRPVFQVSYNDLTIAQFTSKCYLFMEIYFCDYPVSYLKKLKKLLSFFKQEVCIMDKSTHEIQLAQFPNHFIFLNSFKIHSLSFCTPSK